MKKYTLTSYYGGKHHQLIPIMKIIGELGKYNTARAFVECFGGGGRCVLNQEYARYPFTKALYNELDPNMCQLFRYAASPEKVRVLMEYLSRLPYSRSTFDFCRKHRHDDDLSNLDRACIAFVLCGMSYNSGCNSYNGHIKRIEHFCSKIENLQKAPEHLRNVEVLNEDYKRILACFGSDPTVIKYLDPPYHFITRGTGQVYDHEMSDDMHREMVELLCNSRSWVMSGYDPANFGCRDYEPLEKYGAIKIRLKAYYRGSASNRANYGGNPCDAEEAIKKSEYLWIKL